MPVTRALECGRVFSSDMVLPHGKKVPVWGKASSGSAVEVTFKGQRHTVKADSSGRWEVVLNPLKPDAKGAEMKIIEGEKTICLENILIGEVWLASGQSNMQWRMNQSSNREDIPAKENPLIRVMTMNCSLGTNAGAYEIEDYREKIEGGFYTGEWKRSEPSNVASASAVGYMFAKRLQEKLGIPVGLISNAVGGTGMEAWISEETLKEDPLLQELAGEDWLQSRLMSPWARGRAADNLRKLKEAGEQDLKHPFKPGCLYKEGLESIMPFPVSGVLWYQGETNAEIENKKLNTTLLRRLISSWRSRMGNPGLPFVMIQLPRINDKSALRAKWPEFREVQEEVADALPGVYTVCTIDLGSTDSNVHPPDKKPVAGRAADVVLRHLYGKSAPESPRIIKGERKGKVLVLRTNAKALKSNDGKEVRCFEIMGQAGEFFPARVAIRGNSVHVSAEGIDTPLGVRYGWGTFVEPNLVNESGLPLFPYRSLKGSSFAAPLGTFPKGRKVRIACIGDSITAGYGIGNPAHRYPEVLGVMLGDRFEVRNFGNSGKTAGEYPGQKYRKQWYGDNKEYEEAVRYEADIYICNLGINDTGSWWDPKLFRQGYETIIREMKGERKSAFIVWGKLGPDYRGEPGKKAYPGNVFDGYQFSGTDNLSSKNRLAAEGIIADLARKENLYTLDAYSSLCRTPEFYKKDGLHPNEDGARVIAEITYKWLARHYKLRK